jgi:gamma-glutamyltranspeptidase/glutathione hydrolase
MFRVTAAILLGCVALVSAAHAASFRNGIVVAEHRLAAQAGVEILRQGGNAVDAAVATALAVCVVNPTSCGIGGGGFMVIFERRSGRATALDYREAAPAAASRDMFVRNGSADPALSRFGGLAVAVPGEVAGVTEALRRSGTMSFAQVAGPAIALARDGFNIEPHLADSIQQNHERIQRVPALAALLLGDHGMPRVAGDLLQQPALARTLDSIAQNGSRGFYEGRIADSIVSAVRNAGGLLNHEDLRRYRPIWRSALHGTFAGHAVYSMPPPSSGGGVLIETLNILARDDLSAIGHNSPTYVHLLAEAFQFGFAARAAHYGDPDYVRVPLGQLLAPRTAAEIRLRISAARTYAPEHYGALAGAADDHGTSHLSVIDGAGNAVACTTSINTAFGSMIVAGDTGIILNDTMDDFSAQPGVPNVFGLVGSEANAIAPGKRPLSSMSPTIVTRDGAVAAVAGGSGGPFIITGTLQVLLNALVFDQDAEQAVTAPRLHHQWSPPVLMLERGIDDGRRAALARLGHRLADAPMAASVQLVRRAPDGTLDGAADPRKGGRAAGW